MLYKQPANVREPRINYALKLSTSSVCRSRLCAAPRTEQERGQLIVTRWGDCNDDGQVFVALGGMCVIAGGCVAAASSVTPSETASWAAAYLVLVGGVAQVFLGLGQVLVAPTECLARGMPRRVGVLERWQHCGSCGRHRAVRGVAPPWRRAIGGCSRSVRLFHPKGPRRPWLATYRLPDWVGRPNAQHPGRGGPRTKPISRLDRHRKGALMRLGQQWPARLRRRGETCLKVI